MSVPKTFTRKERIYIIGATLLALFLAALDTLVMSAAMPSIVTDLGGLHLYSWVFSAYLLSRAVSLPVFGKLADLYPNKTLYAVSIIVFLVGSVCAGFSRTMLELTLARVIQGIGAGGNFALVYIVLADISSVEERGKLMSYASFVWGLASVLGPSFGGFMVGYMSWRWIFFVNLPLGGLSLIGILLFLKETREKSEEAVIDYYGIFSLTVTILALLTAFLFGGREYAWTSPQVSGLFLLTFVGAVCFYHAEKQSREPILSLDYFRVKGFSLGNSAVFLASLAIFALVSFTPLFIQGTLGRTPAQLGVIMVSLSFGWSFGAWLCGRRVNEWGHKNFALAGALCLIAGSAITTQFTPQTDMVTCTLSIGLAGVGMGFVSISTLLLVQNSIGSSNLGVATSTHQFTRTLGGTLGVGICGSMVTARFSHLMDGLANSTLIKSIPPAAADLIRQNHENLFRPDVQSQLSPEALEALNQAMGTSVVDVFWFSLWTSLACLGLAVFLDKK